MIETLKALLLEHRVITEDGCWYWTRARTSHGYGHFTICGRHFTVHRVAAYLWLGFDFESDLAILHNCDQPACFNPEHLRSGTDAENTADMIRKRRDRIVGTRNSHSLLTEDAVREIRRLADEGIPMRDLATRFGVGRTAIWRITSRRAWTHVR